MRLNRTSLNGLRAVEAVARLGSLKLAADELGVSAGAVSQQVAKTEEQLGRTLFLRSSRSLTVAGHAHALMERLTGGFQTLESALATLDRRAPTTLTVSVAPVLASKWLVPRLNRYSSANPDMMLRIDATTDLANLETSDLDCAIRVGRGGWPGVDLVHLLPQELFPVCSPAIAARLKSPPDILSAPTVRDANSPLTWEIWLSSVGLGGRAMRPGHAFTDAALALDAAIAGQGVMLAWPTLAAHALEAGQLVAPFAQRAATGNGYYLVARPKGLSEPKLRTFLAWLKSEIEDTMSAIDRLTTAPPDG